MTTMFREYWRATKRLGDRNPVALLCWIVSVGSIVSIPVVTSLRKSLGFKVNQYTKRLD